MKHEHESLVTRPTARPDAPDAPVGPMPAWPALDACRAVAVLLVVGYHANGVLGNGYLGVDVFFVLSGFLITTLLLREAALRGGIDLVAFYVRRLLRLYPALLAMCLAVLLIAAGSGHRTGQVTSGALASVTYVANIWEYSGHDTYLLQHTWTLALEEQFYLVWPVLLLLILRARRLAWLVAAAWAVLELVDGVAGQPPVLHTYARAAGLPLGCALAFGMRSPGVRRWLAHLGWPALGAVVVLGCIHPELAGILESWPVSVAAILALPVVAACVQPTSMSAALDRPALIWLGRRSYGIYLWHFPVLSLMINQAPRHLPLTVRLAVGVLVSIGAAAASYRWIELPFLRLKRRFEPTVRPETG